MAQHSPTSKGGTKGRLLRAKPLQAEPLPEESAAVRPVPPAPIPVEPTPPAPIPLDSAANQAPPAPIPLQPAPGAPIVPRPQTTAPTGQPGTAQPQVSRPSARQPAAAGATAAPIILTEQQKQQRGLLVDHRGWQRGRKAVGAREEVEERAEEGAAALAWGDFIAQHRSWGVSAFVHAVLLVVLGLLTISLASPEIDLVSYDPIDEEELEQLEEFQIDQSDVDIQVGGDIVDRPEPEPLEPKIDMEYAREGIDSASQPTIDFSLDRIPENDIIKEIGRGTGQANQPGTGKGKKGFGFGLLGTGGGLGGRGGRRGNAIGRGATKESEEAVELALKWLAEHQLPDGGWSFNHHLAPSCQGQCPNTGEMAEARIAATALGVLPFLGAGQTHQVGKYQRTVAGGLNYLVNRMQVRPEGGSLFEPGGRMYAHGLASIALCEAYGMQVDADWLRKKRLREYDGAAADKTDPKKKQKAIPVPNLGKAAQGALNFIAYAQDPVGGGWRYQPKQPGDTSVVGWQLMALLSGQMAYLRVNRGCYLGATNFLNHVQTDEYGSNYGYTGKERSTKATQAIGLLCRMYLGWAPDHPGITQGVQAMNAAGPSHGNMYYNYYATQVLHHYGGEQWKQWNPRMRDSLGASQSKGGHTAGSWHFGGGDLGSGKGGRLYCTALAAMTLQVYYRHMPLYRKDVLAQGNVEEKPKKKPEDRPHDEF